MRVDCLGAPTWEMHTGLHARLNNKYMLDREGEGVLGPRYMPAKGIGKDVIRFSKGGYFKGGTHYGRSKRTIWRL